MLSYITEQESEGVINHDQAGYLRDCFRYQTDSVYGYIFKGLDFTNNNEENLKENVDIMIDRVLLIWIKHRARSRDPCLQTTYHWLVDFVNNNY